MNNNIETGKKYRITTYDSQYEDIVIKYDFIFLYFKDDMVQLRSSIKEIIKID